MRYSTLLFLLFQAGFMYSQAGMLIGNKASGVPEDCAELEVYSQAKGFLMPVVSDLADISSPAQGLMVYCSATNAYHYFTGSVWLQLHAGTVDMLSDADADTYLHAKNVVAGNDTIVLSAAGARATIADDFVLAEGQSYLVDNENLLSLPADNVVGGANAAVGLSGNKNVLIGESSGVVIGAGSENSAAGAYAVGGSGAAGNLAIGLSAASSSAGSKSVFLGANSGVNSNADSNVFVGSNSAETVTGNLNIMLGNQAGKSSNGRGNIIIGASVDLAPLNNDSIVSVGGLIVGDQKSGNITFSGSGSPYMFPDTAGTDGQALVLNADGYTLEWKNVPRTIVPGIDGASADLAPFDIGDTKSSGYNTFGRESAVAVTSFRTANISHMVTKIKQSGSGSMCMGIYNDNLELMGKGCVASVPVSGYVSVELVAEPGMGLLVEEYQTYYLAIHFLDNNTVGLYQSNTTNYTRYIFNPASLPFDNPITSPSSVGNGFWIRAF